MAINLIKTILAFRSENDLNNFKANFKDYLTETTKLCLFDVDATLGKIDISHFETCLKMRNNDDIVVFERKNGYSHQNYSKHFIVSNDDCDIDIDIDDNNYITIESGNIIPLQFAIDNNIEIKNSLDYTFYNHDTKFSNANGYYDSEFYTVFRGKLVSCDDLTTLNNGDIVYNDDAFYCDECHSWVHDNDTSYNDYTDCYVCDSCNERINEENAENEDSPTNKSFSYHTDVLTYCEFGKPQNFVSGKPVYLGFELETGFLENEVEHSVLFQCLSDGYAIPTQDGSLDDERGVEFVFKPDNFDGHNENLSNFIDDYEDLLYHDAGNGYGLHIHVSSNHLSDFQKIKVQNFVSLFDEQVRLVGKRKETEYQRKKPINKGGDLKNKHYGKYSSVNTSKDNTIEFRFPKALIDCEHIMLNLQLAHAITSYCYTVGMLQIGKNGFDGFYAYIAKYKEYKALKDFIISKDIVATQYILNV